MLTVWLPQEGLSFAWHPRSPRKSRAVLRMASVLGPSGIPSGLASLAVLVLSAACALPAPCTASVLASSLFAGAAPQNFERICGLSIVKPEHGVSSGLWTCRFLAGKAFTQCPSPA